MSKSIKLVLSSILLLITTNVTALPITGVMEMGGSFSPNSVNAAEVTSLEFYYLGTDNKFVVNSASGDFAGVPPYGDIQNIQFEPFSTPVADFWTIGGFSFELTDITRGFTNDPAKFLILNGVGTISSSNPALDDTAATWSFSSDTTGNGIFSWSATATAVPEPGLLFLLSIGLIGIGIRKKL